MYITTGQYLDKGLNTKDAVTSALTKCDGSWGLAVIHKDHPEEIVVACNGSPMVIGLGIFVYIYFTYI
jgi:glucosamine--fructose-6-phosphate aminotransferase (isomerizing)